MLGGVFIPPDRCDDYARYIGREITIADRTRTKSESTHEDLSDLLEQLRKAAEIAETGSAGFRAEPSRNPAAEAFLSCSGQTLTTREAANRTGRSEGYMRRLARHKIVDAIGGEGSAWAFDAGSLDAWVSVNPGKSKNTRKAA